MREKGVERPYPLPVQALDHRTGYLMAAAVVRGVYERAMTGRALRARFSLARTAALLRQFRAHDGLAASLSPETEADLAAGIEMTPWGQARRLKPPLEIAGAPFRWDLPAGNHGRDQASWD